LQFQLEITQLTQTAIGRLPGSAVDTGFVAGITQTMEATLGDQQALARLGQVTDNFLGSGIDHGSTHRHGQDHILALGAGAVGASAVRATLGMETTGVSVIAQGVQGGSGFPEDRAAITTVTPIRATLGNALLTSETHATITTLTGLYRNGYFIYEFHCAPPEGVD